MENTMNINEKHTDIDQETQNAFEEVKKEHATIQNENESVHLDENVVKTSEGETHSFDAQMDSLLSILINSVYSSKDYFLRELISNASDANDKRKRVMYENQMSVDEELSIKIIPNKENSTITIVDTGIGMSKADMINYLGSIASSGTKEFRKKIQEGSGKGDSLDALIGQFGLGFYSAFLVADQVDVISRKSEEEAYIWSSRGPGGFVVAPYSGEHPQGTSVVLHIAEQCKNYLEEKTLENIVKVHSSFIAYPIYMFVLAEKTRPKEAAKKPEEEKDEDAVEDAAAEPAEETETYYEQEYKKLNNQMPLWARDPKEEKITEEEYAEFYKALTNDWEKHFAVIHSFIESDFNIQVLLFVQNRQPFNMFEKGKKAPCNIKLYVQNVLVSNDLSDAIPEWMGFVHGVISSKDIPINVSREIVQGKSVMNLIKRVITKKVLDMLKDLGADKENYMKFYKNCSASLKMGVYQESSDVATKLAKLLRYKTSKSEEPISLEEYISRKAEGQKQIYILTGMNEEDVKSNPALEKMAKYEVLLMDDPIDEFIVQSLNKFNDMPFQRITAEGLELPEETVDVKTQEEELKDVVAQIKSLLGEKVEKVVVSGNLGALPCSITSSKYSYSAAMENILRAQANANAGSLLSTGYLTKKILEINPANGIISGLKNLLGEEKKEEFNSTVSLLFDSAMLAGGFPIPNMAGFSKKIFGYIEMGMGGRGL
ncbi:molecular chaperone HtpG [Nematocida major]|uniref:molecular chaperone HtpG n=1 Tax=Nematocida major TaxID=1912982 RepID=UPI0020088EFB|nr:molecular chaperone HtpG [Nematocida major]KAH9386792.1 molecular chaperone HtpG [Nematocida major]